MLLIWRKLRMFDRNITIVIKHDFLDNWVKSNPVLSKNELVAVYSEAGLEFKLGDGSSTFCELTYVSKISDLLPYFCVTFTDGKISRKASIVMDVTRLYEET